MSDVDTRFKAAHGSITTDGDDRVFYLAASNGREHYALTIRVAVERVERYPNKYAETLTQMTAILAGWVK